MWWRRDGGQCRGSRGERDTRHRDRANPVCDWQGAGGGGRSGDTSQGQAEARMVWADATPRPEHLGFLGPRARKGVDGEVPRTQAPIR